MSQHDYNLIDQPGASFRADLNSALTAVVTNNSGSTEPSTTFAYQWWADTTSGLLKIRNAANTGWVTLGPLTGLRGAEIANTPAGNISSTTVQAAINELDADKVSKDSDTGSARLPAGTTAQRTASPQVGDTRFNTTLGKPEAYNGSTWGPMGGGGATGGGQDDVFYENSVNVTTNYTIGGGSLTSCTISIASPAVITQTNTYVAGQEIRFSTTGALPTGLSTETTYFVSATGLSTSSFRVSTTRGGSSVNTSGTQSGSHSAGPVKNASSAGPVTILDGASVTVPSGATWTII